MRNPDVSEVQEMMESARLARRRRLVKSLLAGQPTDLTNDRDLYLAFNRERLALEDYLRVAAPYCQDAATATAERRAADPSDHAPCSKAKWRHLGNIPLRVYLQRKELWGSQKALKTFLNDFPSFRVSRSRI